MLRPVGFPAGLLSRFFVGGIRHSAFVQKAVANLGDWDRAYRKLERDEPC